MDYSSVPQKNVVKDGFGSIKVEIPLESIVLHIKLKIIKFYGEEVVPVFYETQALFIYGVVYPLFMARYIL